ncbi:MAG: translation initiation factor IF-2 [Epulopiscium sp.]|nr:translation initiation factor IF-2 [Candidatus Epulonipiscium sp.]
MEVSYLSKVRVYEIAKKLNISSKELIEVLEDFGIKVHSHMSSLEDEEAQLIMEYYSTDKDNDIRDNKKSSDSKDKKKKTKLKDTKTEFGEELHQRTDKMNEQKSTKKDKAFKEKEKEVKSDKKDKEEDTIKIIKIPDKITVQSLAQKLDCPATELIKKLMMKGIMASINQEIDFDTASMIAEEYNTLVEEEKEEDFLESLFAEEADSEENLVERPPVVVVMGHVDHGKTSLLDALRKTNVTATEMGGITQHIGASVIEVNGKKITFLDTPGHEAFTAMRMRGAQVTDIAILVVAADDGVMPQTIEAINHAKAANVQIIVAINKIDKPSANPDRVKQELADHGLLAEDWGGDTICVPVSATQKTNLNTLLEMILLVAEMEELKANPNKKARGTIIEAQLDKGRGPVATVLVQNGTLKVGDPILAGSTYGRVRAMMDDKGRRVKSAGPSTPVEIIGLSEVPSAGDAFYVVNSDKEARQIAHTLAERNREQNLRATPNKVSLDDLFNQIQSGDVKQLNIVIKADVQGSVEALRQSLERLSNDEVRIHTIHGGVGAITESDVMLASASNAIIIGFNVRPEAGAKSFAEIEKVDIRLYRVIYNAIEDIEAAMKGLLEPEYKEKVIGHAQVRQTFKASGLGTIGGAYVLDGKIIKNSQVRLVRDGIVVYEGQLSSLKRFKDDVKEVNSGYECGFTLEKFNDIKEGDILEAFIMEEIPRA